MVAININCLEGKKKEGRKKEERRRKKSYRSFKIFHLETKKYCFINLSNIIAL